MTAAHTHGPWSYEKAPATPNDGLDFQVIALTDDGNDTRTIAFTGGEESEANARLIAAAPELLEALKGCVSELRQWIAHHGQDISTNEKISAAKVAIAMTKGAAS